MRLIDADLLLLKSFTVGERPTQDNPMSEMIEVVSVEDINNAPTTNENVLRDIIGHIDWFITEADQYSSPETVINKIRDVLYKAGLRGEI